MRYVEPALVVLVGVYFLGFLFFLWLGGQSGGMISPGLALLRASVWPYYWATGKPEGQPLGMD